MSFPYSYGSLKVLDTLHPDLKKVMIEASKTCNISLINGFRNQADQDRAFAEGKSQKKWPESKHNENPSKAVDCAPYPVSWAKVDEWRFFVMMGHIQAAAVNVGVKLRFGYDFNGNDKLDGFIDLDHVELA